MDSTLPPPLEAQNLRVVRLLESGQPVKIVCFGDSITGVYYHTGGRRAWPEALRCNLQALYPAASITVINAGVSGNTTTHALARMETDVLAHAPHLVVVMLGMNDVALSPAEVFAANLRQIVQRAQQRDAEVLLMTFNAVYPEHPDRPLDRLLAYAEIIRHTARELQLPLADAYDAFDAARARSNREWFRLMSDAIHPSMRGHCLLAATAASAITGRNVAPPTLPRLQPGLPRLQTRMQAGQTPLRVIAMTPFDTLIGPALQTVSSQVRVDVTTRQTSGKPIGELATLVQADWPRHCAQSEAERPDLFVVTVPENLPPFDEEAFYRTCSRLINGSQSFDHLRRWDCLVVLPSVVRPSQSAIQRAAEDLLRIVAVDKDLPVIQRPVGDDTPADELLARELAALLR